MPEATNRRSPAVPISDFAPPVRTSVDFRCWMERRTAADGVLPDRLRYSRKSTESEDRQATSHVQQAGAMDAKWGAIDAVWWWKDSCSGTSFARPAFQDLLDFCRANPRSKKSPGRVEMYDPSRFGRTLDEDGKPDIMAFISVFNEFERHGWSVEFVTVDRTNNDLVDMITMALYAYAAALYSKNLSENVLRGRLQHAANGWWVAGTAPWGTKRFDTASNRVLEDGERSSPGGGGTILVPDKQVLRHWKPAVNRILAGASLDSVGAALYEQGVRGPRGGKVGHAALRNFLTNPALIGVVEYYDRPDAHGSRERRRVKANWEPMVDVALFEEASKRLDGHTRARAPRRRRRRELYPLAPVCAHCGVEYNGGRLSAAQGAARGYVHAQPKERMDEEAHRRFKAQGCRVWYVDAEELENKIKDVITAERTSEEFVAEIRALIQERDVFRTTAAGAVTAAEKDVAAAKAEYAALARTAAQVAARLGAGAEENEDADDPLAQQLVAAKQRQRAAEAELENARAFARSRARAWERLEGIIHESRNLGAAWEKAGPEERRILFDYWVLDVLIVVEPIPGMKRANHKTALVRLRSAPNAPRHFELEGARQRSVAASDTSAAARSSRTAASGSTSRRSRRAAAAATEPSRPSAQAACDRTSGSSSDSAAASAGTSSSVPTLPSTTAALRLSPRNFARFMGDPLKAAENSGCDMDSSSSASDLASLPASAERAANDGSDSSRANLWLYGQTS
ncbi:MAG TPA: recombinase family protein [Gemmatimonadaceae bacterium]|nr:recombinase family protein [Gemmatimonadaceae bacterium]